MSITVIPFRTRFAPSPTGIMHIGNLRSALMSFLCARESGGSFILRIEDTDETRSENCFLELIYTFLTIMKLLPDEGPLQGGEFQPYIQSQRGLIYQKYLNLFLEKKLLYRCFQTIEELEENRKKQIDCKLPPRYRRIFLSEDEEKAYLDKKKAFVWRLAIPKKIVKIQDKVKGIISYDLANFADSPITRQDGSFTFLFANFVDDVEMKINYVIRGEEHISNTAIQAFMYESLSLSLPLFYHLPLICDNKGKKLSKRDFGFNIKDLLNEGFLPQAILNYLSIIGSSCKEEIFDLEEAIKNNLFSKSHASGMITYDINKLMWVNKKWMQKLDTDSFISYIKKTFDQFDIALLLNKDLVTDIKNESHTIKEFFSSISAIYNCTEIKIELQYKEYIEKIKENILSQKNKFVDWNELKLVIKGLSKRYGHEEKKIYQIVRYVLIKVHEGVNLSLLCRYISQEDFLKKIEIISYE